MKKKTIGIILTLALCVSLTVPAFAAEQDIVPEITIATHADSSITFTLTNVSGYCSDEKGLGEYRRIVVFFTKDSVLTCNTDMLEKVGNSSMEAYFFPEYLGANLDARLEEGLVKIIPAGTPIKISDMSEDGIRGRAIQLPYGHEPNGHEIKLDPTEDMDWYKDNADHYELIPISALSVVESAPSSTPDPTPAPSTPSSWAADQVNAAIAANLVPDSLQSAYTQATTRAEFCALAVALYENIVSEITERTTFDDTDDANVEKAAAIGVVNGVAPGTFSPDAGLTREQAATMLARLADAVGKPLAASAPTFADNDSVSDWAIGAVGQVQATEIMGGVGNNTFAPKDPYTREQSIITIMRLFDIVK